MPKANAQSFLKGGLKLTRIDGNKLSHFPHLIYAKKRQQKMLSLIFRELDH